MTTEEGIQIEQKDGKANIIMDMSMFDVFELCQCRYDYRHNHNRGLPIEQKAKALDMGGLAHEGLEQYFNALKRQEPYSDRMQKCLMKIRQVSSDPSISNSDPDEVNLVLNAVEESCDFWRYEDEQLIVHEVERAFAYVLYEDEFVRIIITGKIDLLVDKPSLGHSAGYTNLPIDHKTFKREFEVPRLSNQFMNYCSATGSNYLIVNRIGLHDPEAKKPKPADEKFKRIPLSYDPFILAEWRENVKNVILDEYLSCLATGRWKMNFTGCLAFNRKCEYYEICETSGIEDKMRKLEDRFVPVSPWDVTSKFTKG